MEKKQHYLPQFLLKGFSSGSGKNNSKNKKFIWHFHKNIIREDNIRKIACKDYFYGNGIYTELDDKIIHEGVDYPRCII